MTMDYNILDEERKETPATEPIKLDPPPPNGGTVVSKTNRSSSGIIKAECIKCGAKLIMGKGGLALCSNHIVTPGGRF